MKFEVWKKLIIGFGAVTSLACPLSSFAIECKAARQLQDDVMTLSGDITVGEDVPVGTVVYKARYVTQTYTGVHCDAAFNLENWIDYLNIPGAYTGLELGGVGKVYATNLPGLGAAVTGDNNGVTPRLETYLKNDKAGEATTGHAYFIKIVKIGNVSPGVLQGTSLPSIHSYIKSKAGYSGLPVDIIRLRFSGGLNIVSKTCKTPDFDVSLGKYEINKYFKGNGSVTPWIDSSITLSDCPVFKGYYGNKNHSINISGSGTTPSGIPDANSLSVSLKPVQQIIDAANGVMAVSSAYGGNTALGVGIQIGWGSASGDPTLFNFNESKNFAPPNDGRSSFKIPLAARYIQTDTAVSPGRADGKAVFVINYY